MAEPLSVASGIAGLLSLTINITQLSFGFISDVRKASSIQKEYLQELSALNEVLLKSEHAASIAEDGVHSSRRPAQLSTAALADCETQLKALQKILHSCLATPRSNVLWPIKDKPLRNQIDNLQRFRSVFSTFLTAQTLITVSETHGKVDRLEQHQDRQDLLVWLGDPTDASSAEQTPCEGTGSWLLESDLFRDWAHGTRTPARLWCHGPPGVGKSMLASLALQNLRQNAADNSNVVLRFFCDFANRKTQSKAAVWGSLLRQAIWHGGAPVHQTVADLRSQIGTARPVSVKELSTVLSSLCSSQPIIVVIDGLDELGSISDIKATLQPLMESDCRLLVFSRHLLEISSMLAPAADQVIQADPKDLLVYLSNTFHLNDMDDMLTEHPDLVTEIIDKCDGIFLVVAILVNHLLELSTLKEMRVAIRSFPVYLERAFESTLERIDAQSKSHRELAHRVMGWVTSAARKLQISELLHGLAVEEDNTIDTDNIPSRKTILKVCSGLVIVDAQTGFVSMVHGTVYAWYQNLAYDCIQVDIATTCLRYLSLQGLSSGPATSSADMDARLQDLRFLAYAARYWRNHIADEKPGAVISNLISKMFADVPRVAAVFQAAIYQHHVTDSSLRSATFDAMPTSQSSMHFAAFWNLPDTLSTLLVETSDVNVRDSQDWTPLHWAAFAQSTASAELLIVKEADVHAKDSAGWTPLTRASLNGDANLVATLLRNGANYLAQDNHGWTALRWAVARQQKRVMAILMEHHERHVSALRAQSQTSNTEVTVPTALQYMSTDTHETSLLNELANITENLDLAEEDSSYLYRVLANNQVGLDELWSDGHFDTPVGNPWRTAQKGGSENLVHPEFLSRKQHRNHAKDNPAAIWRASLLYAAIEDSNLIALKLILHLGVDVNHSRYRKTPLHIATFRKDPSFAELLIKHGANIDAKDWFNVTPLQQAVMNGFAATSELLASRGANLNASSEVATHADTSRYRYERHVITATYTPLMLALHLDRDSDPKLRNSEPKLQIINMLLKRGANVDSVQKHEDGMEVIHYTASTCDSEIIQLIIEAGCNCKALDRYGRTVFHHLAQSRGQDPGSAAECDEYGLFPAGGLAHATELLHRACGSDYINKTAACKKYCKRSNTWIEIKHTPLSLAIAHRNWELAQIFQNLGARLETNAAPETLLPYAVQSLQATVVELLVRHGITFTQELTDRIDWMDTLIRLRDATPPVLARFKTILEHLKTCGVHLNNMLGYWSPTRIHHLAISSGRTGEIAQLLLDFNACPYLPTSTGMDAFLAAALEGRTKYLQCLLKHAKTSPKPNHWTNHLTDEAKPDTMTVEHVISNAIKCAGMTETLYDHGRTLLSLAADHGNINLATALLQTHTRAIIHSETGHQDAIELNTLDEKQRTPLHLAAMKGHVDIVRLLLAEGAAPNLVDTDGFLPVHMAAKGHTETFRILIQAWPQSVTLQTRRLPSDYSYYRPSRLNPGDRWGATLLHLAAMDGNLDMVRTIFEAAQGIPDIDLSSIVRTQSNKIKNENGTTHTWEVITPGAGPTALHIALDRGIFHGRRTSGPLSPQRLHIAEILIEHGAAIEGVACGLKSEDVANFQGFEGLWEKLRVGIKS